MSFKVALRPTLDRIRANLASLRYRERGARKKAREKVLEDIKAKRLASAKWGVSYSVFDGEELLEASLYNIRPHVDYINVMYQDVSWYGVAAAKSLYTVLERLRAANIVDEIILYDVDLALKPAVNERKKRNLGLERAKKAGCTHFMTMDCDEFYRAEELEAAKKVIVDEGITHSYCPIFIYADQPDKAVANPPYRGYCSFFSEITPASRLKKHSFTPCLVDATRQMSHFYGAKYWVFDDLTQLYHMSQVRHDVDSKIANSSFFNGERKLTKIDFGKYVTYEIPDYFSVRRFWDEALRRKRDTGE